MATFGGGIKYALRPRILLRVEVRDYFSRFPTQVIAPAPGSHLAGCTTQFPWSGSALFSSTPVPILRLKPGSTGWALVDLKVPLE
ncbi:MAG TPA: hypothetical protein VNH83_03800 [Bryobacteraceae bacterium]|nr:hypothetical protein [Bryobacteraceae bacterium]